MLVLVIGAGVIGLATGRALALRGHEVIVAEASDAIGSGVSSRNSEVIHAGMYYPSGSLRARHCVTGRKRIYAFCESHGIPHRRCGKLIVATSDEEAAKIAAIHDQGRANGVESLEWLDRSQAVTLEPQLNCTAAFLSAETGILDSHAFMLALQGEIEDAGGAIAFLTPVEALGRSRQGWLVRFGGASPGEMLFDAVVNAAGLGAPAIARATDAYPAERVPKLVLSKGNYFGYSGRPPFSRLIYPAPVDGGLGIHLTLDMSGRVRFGPDVQWIDQLDYTVDPERARQFYTAIRRYWPGLPDGSLFPDYCGIRPKLTGPGMPAADFVIEGEAEHGLDRLIMLFGIESPGLTSSLSIAEEIADRLEDRPAAALEW
ncbi:NAD(P)/FAD-dependent oxidoreductase [Rhodoligotrophos ferricapiens]|uniref:NAD(P)/FAD-dependent oxidoreductase n=1 Tax=Rhodoligotrophos ferricapiens TaxID=3069264 RepID=UPI00315DE3F9